jgi:outer membrane protein assembly factor BamE (lipoprotein component of BamABCDE complex)
MSSFTRSTTAQSTRRLKLATWALIAALAGSGLAACSPTVEYRGYLPSQNALQQIQPGMSKTEVEALLGSPSTTATINYSGDSYYYISSIVEQSSFLDPQEVDRSVVAIRFSQFDQVESFAQYGLQDGQIIDFSSRKTPTHGKELTILQQIFSNIGRFNPGTPTQ